MATILQVNPAPFAVNEDNGTLKPMSDEDFEKFKKILQEASGEKNMLETITYLFEQAYERNISIGNLIFYLAFHGL